MENFVEILFALILLINISNINSKRKPNITSIGTRPRRFYSDWTFKNYIEKFNAINVYNQLNEGQNGNKWGNLTEKELQIIADAMDPTEELLKLDIDKASVTTTPTPKDGRRWIPPGIVLTPHRARDPYLIRPRLYNLMKQVIYQARDSMGIVQLYRNRYRNDSLYRMGFLLSKTDTQLQIFAQLILAAYSHCSLLRKLGSDYANKWIKTAQYELVEAEERAINLWFEIDLLTDVIYKNDGVCRNTITRFQRGQRPEKSLRTWFVDEFEAPVDAPI